MRVAIELEKENLSVRRARHFVGDVLRGWHVDGNFETPLLLTSELVSNAVRHGEGPIRIRAIRQQGGIRVEVEDSGGGRPVLLDPAPTDLSGRGLLLVDGLSHAWGYAETGGGGKIVWFSVGV